MKIITSTQVNLSDAINNLSIDQLLLLKKQIKDQIIKHKNNQKKISNGYFFDEFIQ